MNTNASSLSLVLLFLFPLFIYVFEAEGVELCCSQSRNKSINAKDVLHCCRKNIIISVQEIIRLC